MSATDVSLSRPASEPDGAPTLPAPEQDPRPSLPAPASLFDGMADAPSTSPSPSPGPPLRDELSGLELQLDAVRAELDRQRAVASERDARCQELELAAARDRRAAEHEIEYTTSNLVRAHAIAVADRDRAVAQHEEAVGAREAAVRTRQRMEVLRDEALAERDAAQARRDEAIAQRDEARRQRDELRSAHRALQKQLKTATAHATPKRAVTPPGVADGSQPSDEPALEEPTDDLGPPALQTATPRLRDSGRRGSATGSGSGSGSGLTDADLWGIRFLGTVGAVCFITLLVFIMKAVVGL
jgi:hypothetical protein